MFLRQKKWLFDDHSGDIKWLAFSGPDTDSKTYELRPPNRGIFDWPRGPGILIRIKYYEFLIY